MCLCELLVMCCAMLYGLRSFKMCSCALCVIYCVVNVSGCSVCLCVSSKVSMCFVCDLLYDAVWWVLLFCVCACDLLNRVCVFCLWSTV